ncbi:DUF2812 domain-containing protein [Jeotgalibaca sp. A127]|uniref:DUF2812 domain-containing protein n=1 Tax=Jeotgalibaca sp. A127 TaxID=3457324 RepID=UPI003FD5D539
MRKYKLAGGFAMSPEREVKLFKEMSKKGWHLDAVKGLFYRFEKGTPHDYHYALNAEMKTNQEMLVFYKASGWEPVLIGEGYQVFRAEPGTPPIFSDKESQMEVLERNQVMSGKHARLFGVLLVIWMVISGLIDLGVLEVIGMVVLMVGFIFTLFPYLGFTRSLKKLKQSL